MHLRALSPVLVLLCGAPGPLRAEGPAPLPPPAAEAFAAVRPDRPPPELIRDTHYIISNEDRPQAFRAAITDRGGVYIGVGSEQNYLLAGWARPEVLVLMDFDQVVVDLHRVYRAFLLDAPDGAALERLWQPASEAQALAVLAAAYPGDRGALRAYRIARHAVPARLAKMRRLLGAAGERTFLDDAEQYAYLQGLARAGRIFPVRGDLTADRTVRDIGAATRAAGLPVRVLYLSNAERYFPYGPEFKENMLALPFDDRSVVLRTTARRIGAYEYLVQDGPGFHAWLRLPRVQKVWQLARLREADPQSGAWFIRRLPGER